MKSSRTGWRPQPISATSRSPMSCGSSAARTHAFPPEPASPRRLNRCCASPDFSNGGRCIGVPDLRKRVARTVCLRVKRNPDAEFAVLRRRRSADSSASWSVTDLVGLQAREPRRIGSLAPSLPRCGAGTHRAPSCRPRRTRCNDGRHLAEIDPEIGVAEYRRPHPQPVICDRETTLCRAERRRHGLRDHNPQRWAA